jgi:hypothetical protein
MSCSDDSAPLPPRLIPLSVPLASHRSPSIDTSLCSHPLLLCDTYLPPVFPRSHSLAATLNLYASLSCIPYSLLSSTLLCFPRTSPRTLSSSFSFCTRTCSYTVPDLASSFDDAFHDSQCFLLILALSLLDYLFFVVRPDPTRRSLSWIWIWIHAFLCSLYLFLLPPLLPLATPHRYAPPPDRLCLSPSGLFVCLQLHTDPNFRIKKKRRRSSFLFVL